MKSFARTGERLAEALARRRVTLGFIAGAVVLWLAQPTGTTLVAGAMVACAGEMLRIWAAGHLNKSREVTSSGPYRWFAHPLYVGSSIMGAGLAIASGRPIVGVLVAIYVGLTLTAAAKTEEALLRRSFGDRYDQYKRASGAVSNGASREAADRRFSIDRALANRELRAVIGLAVAILLLFFKATYNDLFARSAGQ